MKKITKTLVALACVATLGAGVGAISACGGDKDNGKTGEAYSIVHNGSSIGYSAITVKDNKITKVVLEDVCFPTQVKKDGEIYAKVTYDNVTLTYDAEAKSYMVGEQTFGEYVKTEANAKAYYNAVINNKVTAYETADASTGSTTVMTKNTLLKGQDGCAYWATNNPNQKMNYKDNRDATVAYVLKYGIEGLDGLKFVAKTEGEKEYKYWMKGEISTGATWTDLYGSNADNVAAGSAKGAITYAKLMQNAYARTK